MNDGYINLRKLTTVSEENAFNYDDAYYANLAQKHPLVAKLLDYADCKAAKNEFPQINFVHEDDGRNKGYFDTVGFYIQIDDTKTDDVLIHELSHVVMYQLFENNAYPFYENICEDGKCGTSPAEIDYRIAVDQTYKNMKGYNFDIITRWIWTNNELIDICVDFTSTTILDFNSQAVMREYIAKLPEYLISKNSRASYVEELMQPLVDYYNNYIIPSIDSELAQGC